MDLHTWMTSDLAALRGRLFDSVVALVPTERWHQQADGGGSTITGLLLHLARHQDLAVNAVVRNHEPLFTSHRAALGCTSLPLGVGLSELEDLAATATVPADALVAYVTAVFDTTQTWLADLGGMALDVQPAVAYHLTNRAGLEQTELPWLFQMWGGKPLWWFVQWPVLGHGNAHAGEAISVRNRMGLSPF